MSINSYMETCWNLPDNILENCDVYILHTYTYYNLKARLLHEPDGTNSLLKYDLKYPVVWQNEALAVYNGINDLNYIPNFIVSFRKYGKIKRALIQHKRK